MTVSRGQKYTLLAGLAFACLFLFMDSRLGHMLLEHVISPSPLAASAEPTTTVELAYVGYDNHTPRVFTIGSAVSMGFTDVYIGEDRYRKTGKRNATWFRTAASGQRPRYKVTEYRLEPSNFDRLLKRGKAEFGITDTLTNKELAHWEVWKDGWPHEQAGKVIVATLKPQQVLSQGDPNDQLGTAYFVTSTITLPATDLYVPLRNCPETYVVAEARMEGAFEVRTPKWIFGTRSYPRNVVCSADRVFVFTATTWGSLEVYWLSYDGVLNGEVHANVKELIRANYPIPHVFSVTVKDGHLRARLAYFRDNPGAKTLIAETAMDIVAPMVLTP
jgi:hypothetical protein